MKKIYYIVFAFVLITLSCDTGLNEPATPENPLTKSISGTVYWSDTPLEGIRVFLSTEIGSPSRDQYIVSGYDTITGVDGSYSFDISDLPNGDYWVNFQTNDVTYWSWRATSRSIVDSNPDIVVDAYMAKKLQLTAPVNNATDISITPTFSWEAVNGAAEYTFYAFNRSTFIQEFEVSGITDTQYTPTSPFDYGTEYEWDIDAYAANGRCIAYANYYFTTESNPQDYRNTSWSASNIDISTGGVGTDDLVVSIGDTSGTSVWAAGSVGFDIVKTIDDTTFIMQITSHPVPAFVGQYQKFTLVVSGTSAVFTSCDLKPTLLEAENETIVTWGPVNAIKQ